MSPVPGGGAVQGDLRSVQMTWETSNQYHNHNQFFQRNLARSALWQEVLCNGDKTFSNGYLGYCNDEERSEMRYVMRIAEPRESSNL